MSSKPIRTFTVNLAKRRGFFYKNTIGAAFYGIPPLNETVLGSIPPLSRSSALQLQTWFGLQHPDSDADDLELYLRAVDIDNLPDVSSMRLNSEWMAAHFWSVLGAGTGHQQVLEKDGLVIISKPVANVELADRTRDFRWAILLNSVAGGAVIVMGTFAYDIELIQRVWGDDAYTWNGDPGQNNRDGISEIDMDIY